MLTGHDLRPMTYVENLLKMHDIPVIVSNASTFDTMDRIRRCVLRAKRVPKNFFHSRLKCERPLLVDEYFTSRTDDHLYDLYDLFPLDDLDIYRACLFPVSCDILLQLMLPGGTPLSRTMFSLGWICVVVQI